MTDYSYLDLPISERIQRYENEFLYGTPVLTKDTYCSRPYQQNDLRDYVLYRLKREEFERAEKERLSL